MDWNQVKKYAKRAWHFLWHEDSVWSWIANVIVAFILIKYIVYPGLGLMLGTGFPVVAVISSSMEHHPGSFDAWWDENEDWYLSRNISEQDFQDYRFTNGFNKGDIMILVGSDDISHGDVIVFQTMQRREPIIHRVVEIDQKQGFETYTTKGDNNAGSLPFEHDIVQRQIYGKAVVRVPFLGYVKILFLELLEALNIV